jgi:hypothetical protein
VHLKLFVSEDVCIEIEVALLRVFRVDPESQLVPIGSREGLKVAENELTAVVSVCFL